MDEGKYNDLLAQAKAAYKAGGTAIGYLDKCVEENPNFLEAYIARGTLSLLSGENLQQALDDFSKAIALSQKDPELYICRSNAYIKMGNSQKAIEDSTKAIELDANRVLAYVNRAEMYMQMEEYQKAINDLDKAVAIDPSAPDPYFKRGAIHAHLHNSDKAINDLSKVIELHAPNETCITAYGIRALTYLKMNEYKKAIDDYSKAIELHAHNEMNETIVEAYNNRALAYLNMNEYQKAIDDYSKVIDFMPNEKNAYFNRSLAYMNLEKANEAFADCNKVIELAPEYADVYVKRGILYSHFGNIPAAIRDYEKFFELGTGTENAALVREELEKLKSKQNPAYVDPAVYGSHDAPDESEKNRAAYLKFSAIMIAISSIIGIIVGINMAGYHDKLFYAWIGMGVGGNLWLFLSHLFKELREEMRGKEFIDAIFDTFKTALVMGILLFIVGAVTGPIIPTVRILRNWGKSLWVIIAAVVGMIFIFFVAFTIANYEAKPAKEKNNVQVTETEESQARTDAFTDSRDNKTYKTVKIGNQTWMAQNLDYNLKGSRCYDNNDANCRKYGRMYNWKDALVACPEGWHLPSDNEWQTLLDFVGGADFAGVKLKSKEGWNDNDGKNGNGNDEYGFLALPGGYANVNKFIEIANFGIWWNSTASDNGTAWRRGMSNKIDGVGRIAISQGFFLSVRCVQNLP
ncbi:MAG: tetratricopeptide repeat protein [Fibromonadales bacterium]|nr:tetratricopeptide repeat protein [Fibromonadales bacterium]